MTDVALSPPGALGAAPASPAPVASAERAGPGTARRDGIVAGVVYLLGLASCLARSPNALLHPVLYAEDGKFWFADAYNRGWLAPLGEAHTGYLQSFPRLVADLGLLVPLAALPAFFVAVAVAVQALPAALLASRRLARVVPSRTSRLVLAAAYLSAPNSREVNANLTNAQWHLALLAVLVVLSAPAGPAWTAFDVVVVALSCLTGPFCVALLVVTALFWLLRRERRVARLLVAIALVSAVQLVELATSPRGHFGPLGANVRRFVEIAGGQIVGGTFLGSRLSGEVLAGRASLWWCSAMLALGAVLVAAAVSRGPVELRLFNLFAGLVLGASLLTPVASVDHPQWQALAFDPQMRYWLFPTLALLADAIWLAARRRPRAVSLVGVGAVLVAAGLAVPSQWHYRALPRLDWPAEVRAFDSAPAHTRVVLKIDPARWKMVLDKH